jgi:hypothetical protein
LEHLIVAVHRRHGGLERTNHATKYNVGLIRSVDRLTAAIKLPRSAEVNCFSADIAAVLIKGST